MVFQDWIRGDHQSFGWIREKRKEKQSKKPPVSKDARKTGKGFRSGEKSNLPVIEFTWFKFTWFDKISSVTPLQHHWSEKV